MMLDHRKPRIALPKASFKNKILVAKEKHGDRYFKADSAKALDSACKRLIRERLKEHWYLQGILSSRSLSILAQTVAARKTMLADIPKFKLNKADMALYIKLGEEPVDTELRAACQDSLNKATAALKEHEKAAYFLSRFKEILRKPMRLTGAGYPESFALLQLRNSHEYEYVYLDDVN